MGSILKEIIKELPSNVISEFGFEGANIVLYTKSRDFYINGQSEIKQLVSKFKKRIELRPDPIINLNEEDAKKEIRKIIPKEVKLDEFIFDKARSIVTLSVDKPGLAIGKRGSLLKEIKEKTFWVPIISRIPPIKSKIIGDIREFIYAHQDQRKKFLNKTGHRVYDGWIRGKKEEWVRISFLGGAREIGRSAFLLQTPESRVLLDFGFNVASEEDAIPFMDVPEFHYKDLDAVIVSHAHIDHSGLIPFLFKLGYDGPVYCTSPTRDVMALLQLDFIKIAVQSGKTPLYSVDDIKKMVLNTITLGYDEVTDITPDIRLTLYNAGHILGSAIVHLHIGNGLHNLVYTGDLRYGKSILYPRAHKAFNRVESLIMESTYGGKEDYKKASENSDDQLKEYILKTIKRGGKVLMPVLGSGKAQDVMVILAKMIRTKEIKPLPIFIDGLVWDITAIHTAYPEFMNREIRDLIFHKDQNPFLMDVFKRVGSPKEREKVIYDTGSCIILATSGMLTGGPSMYYLKELSDDKKNMLIFTSYQAQNTLGRRIMAGEKEFTLGDSRTKKDLVKINIEVAKVAVSDHSDRRELMNYVRDITPKPKKVIIVHGEKSKATDLAASINRKFSVETDAPANVEVIRLK